MKNIFEKTKTFMKENKAKTVIALACIALLVPLLVYGIIKTVPEDTASTANSGKKITAVADVKTDVKEDKQEGKKKDETSQSDSAVENKSSSKEKSKSNTSSNSSSATASKSGNTSNNSTPPAKKKVWIVDKAAWTETVQIPVYEDVDVYNLYAVLRGTTTEEFIGKYYSYAEVDAAIDNLDRTKYGASAYSLTYETKIVRYDTKTINHPEEGHWEYK